MWSQVFLLPEGGSLTVDGWEEEAVGSEESRRRWELSASAWPRHILKEPALTTGGHPPLLLNFICLNGDLMEGGYETAALRSQLHHARQHNWGAPIYVVVDQRSDMQSAQLGARAARAEWFKTMSQMGVSDVIELPLPLPGADRPQPKLREAAARALGRSAVIGAHARPGTWRCVFHRHPNPIQKSFLSPFLAPAPDDDPEGHYVLVVGGNGGKPQRDFISRAADAWPHLSFIVARVDETGEEPTDELVALCRRRGLELIHDSFRGLFELYFFIRRLEDESQRRGVAGWRPADWSEAMEAVEVSPQPRFESPTRPQRLLITHAFARGAHPDYCAEAARDCYELTKELPHGTTFCIHPAVSCEALPGVVGSAAGDVTAWVHIGHGERGEGLQESGGGEYLRSPEEWLACFESYRGSLALACFAACESTAVARYFAEAGVGVSIGFEENVPLKDCRMVLRDVVRAALTTHGNRHDILNAFERSRHFTQAGATAFCADH